MFKKLIVVFIFIIALNSSCWAGLAFSPVVQLGFQGNDNIDQVPTGSIYDTSLKLGAGFYLDSYLSPDLYLSGGLFQINQKYSNSSYGYTNESNLLLVMEYDLNERLIFGLDNNQISYSDGVIEDNNYNSMICMPRFLFYFTPYTALGVQQENTALKYNNSETVQEQKNGGFISQQLAEGISLTIGGDNSFSNSSITSNNYTAQGSKVGLMFNFNQNNTIQINYSNEVLKYPDWVVDRTDQKRLLAFNYRVLIAQDWEFSLGVTSIQNNSKDDTQDYLNNIAFLSFGWKPIFGNIYGEEAISSLEYYYLEGIKYYEEQQWAAAEKQFRKVAFNIEDYPEAHFYLGYCLSKQGKYAESIYSFEKVIELDNTYAEAYYLLAHAYIKTAQEEKAKQVLKKLLNLREDQNIREWLNSL